MNQLKNYKRNIKALKTEEKGIKAKIIDIANEVSQQYFEKSGKYMMDSDINLDYNQRGFKNAIEIVLFGITVIIPESLNEEHIRIYQSKRELEYKEYMCTMECIVQIINWLQKEEN